jgi:hypothetical protein
MSQIILRDLGCLVLSYLSSYTSILFCTDIERDTIPFQIKHYHYHYHYPLLVHTLHPFILHITLDVNMSLPLHHASSSSLAMATPSPPTRSGSESRLLDLPNSGTRSTLPKTRSPLSPSPYMDIVRFVVFYPSLLLSPFSPI